MTDDVITVGNTVTLTLPPPGQPPARGWGQTSDVCHQASASVSGPSLGLASVRKLEAGCVSPTLASREWGYPLSSALSSGHTYHITFPLISECLVPGIYLVKEVIACYPILLFAVLNIFLQFLPTMLMTKVTGSIQQSIKFNNSIPNFISLFSK